MSAPSLQYIVEKAEDLKSMLWDYMDANHEHKGVKITMNELLDLINELDL